MRQIENIRELQELELNILIETVKYFEANSITWILAGGSMLGAVRHNGFIPWDDDIDILVPRDDYDRLLKVFDSTYFEKANYGVMKPGVPGYPYPYMKVVDKTTLVKDDNVSEEYNNMGVWIDVFPLDHFPDNRFLHKICLLKNKILRTILMSKLKSCGLGKGGKLSNAFFGLLNTCLGGCNGVSLRIDSLARKQNRRYRYSKHYGDGTWPLSEKDYFSSDSIFPITKHVFEGEMMNIPLNYDKYLTSFYGDYLTPPPVEKRARHLITAFIL